MEVVAHHRSPRPATRDAVIAELHQALASGADRVEVDVFPHRSGLVVAHDDGVVRGADVLALDDALELLAGEGAVTLLADIKHPGVGPALGAALAAHQLGSRTMVCGEWQAVIEAAERGGAQAARTLPARPQAAPGPFGLATRRARERVRGAAVSAIGSGRCVAVCVDRRFVDDALIAAVRGSGGRLFAWTPDRERDLRRLAALRVDGLITNEPALARRVRAAALAAP